MTFRHSIDRAVHAVLFIAFVVATMFASVAAAAAQMSAQSSRAVQPQAGSPPLTGGIFQADLNVPIRLIGWVETFGGCPDGDTGNWTWNSPGYGLPTQKLLGFPRQGNCPANPPCDDNGPNPQGTKQCYNTLIYTLTQPIPCGLHDTLNATWQSGHVSQPGTWTPAYIPFAVTHNYFGPCTASQPFGSGIPFGRGVAFAPTEQFDVALWRMGQGANIVSAAVIGSVPATWSIIGQRDFNGDGYTDFLWRDSTTGAVGIWFMNGFQITSTKALGVVPSTWVVYGTGNLDQTVDNLGNRPGNILWRDSTTGNVAIWYMSGGNISSTGSLGIVAPSWTIVGSDNHGNIFWRDTSGTVAVWQVTPGPTVAASGVLGANVPSNWTIAGLGDFYGDGNAGILWRDGNTGTVAIWKVQGTQVQSTTSLGVVPSAWSIVQTGDYNGDGTSDILWVDNSGNLAIWFLSAGHISSTAGIGNIGTSWIVQSANSE